MLPVSRLPRMKTFHLHIPNFNLKSVRKARLFWFELGMMRYHSHLTVCESFHSFSSLCVMCGTNTMLSVCYPFYVNHEKFEYLKVNRLIWLIIVSLVALRILFSFMIRLRAIFFVCVTECIIMHPLFWVTPSSTGSDCVNNGKEISMQTASDILMNPNEDKLITIFYAEWDLMLQTQILWKLIWTCADVACMWLLHNVMVPRQCCWRRGENKWRDSLAGLTESAERFSPMDGIISMKNYHNTAKNVETQICYRLGNHKLFMIRRKNLSSKPKQGRVWKIFFFVFPHGKRQVKKGIIFSANI